VGGLREKLLAARRAGVTHVVLPLKNSVDIESLPAEICSDLKISYIGRISEAVGLVLRK